MGEMTPEQALAAALQEHQHGQDAIGYCYEGHGADTEREAAAILAALPSHRLVPVAAAGTRLTLVSESLLEQWGTRTADGRKLTAEWGDRRPEGWYEPTFTATDDGMALVPVAELEQLRRIEAAARVAADKRYGALRLADPNLANLRAALGMAEQEARGE